MMKKCILSIIEKKYLLILLICILGLHACDDNGVGDPLPAKLKIEKSAYDVSITKTAIADTTVATIKWIDIKSPSYTLTLSNSANDKKIELPGMGTAAENNVLFITISDKQLLDYLTQMQLVEGTTATLKLTITGTKTDGKPDEVSTTINVTTINT